MLGNLTMNGDYFQRMTNWSSKYCKSGYILNFSHVVNSPFIVDCMINGDGLLPHQNSLGRINAAHRKHSKIVTLSEIHSKEVCRYGLVCCVC